MRLIDADALEEKMLERETELNDDKALWESSAVSVALDMFAPTVDAIELEPIAKEFDELVQTKPNTEKVDKWCSMKMREILCDYFAKKGLEEIGE